MTEFDKMIAQMDQAGEAVKLIAPVVSAYFVALLNQGFTREEALSLTLAYQNMLFLLNTNPKP